MGEKVNTREVMEILEISRRTVQEYVKSGKLRPERDAQGHNWFLRSAVEALKPRDPAQGGVRVAFTFEPSRQVIVDREHYEGLLVRLAQLEAQARLLDAPPTRPWWKRLFGWD